jgi:hypothetical protein
MSSERIHKNPRAGGAPGRIHGSTSHLATTKEDRMSLPKQTDEVQRKQRGVTDQTGAKPAKKPAGTDPSQDGRSHHAEPQPGPAKRRADGRRANDHVRVLEVGEPR